MAEWMTGVMMVDQLALEILMGAMQAINNPAGMSGATMVSLPTELSAALQAETTASVETGATAIYWTAVFGDGDLYPI